MAGSGKRAAGLAKEAEVDPKDVEKIFDAIVAICNRGERVQLSGFGTFTKKHIPERQQRLPVTGEMVTVKEHNTMSFRPHGKLKMRMGG